MNSVCFAKVDSKLKEIDICISDFVARNLDVAAGHFVEICACENLDEAPKIHIEIISDMNAINEKDPKITISSYFERSAKIPAVEGTTTSTILMRRKYFQSFL
jgi:hypothetical protein